MSHSDHHSFNKWWAPEQLRLAADEIGAELGEMALRRPGKKYREAFVASRFAEFRGADTVRLLPEREKITTPDFEMRFGGTAQRFEITEADRPGRKRADDKHMPIKQLVCVPHIEWTEPEEYQALVACRAQSKAAKLYDHCQGLLIWSNAWQIADQDQLRLSGGAQLANRLRAHLERFGWAHATSFATSFGRSSEVSFAPQFLTSDLLKVLPITDH